MILRWLSVSVVVCWVSGCTGVVSSAADGPRSSQNEREGEPEHGPGVVHTRDAVAEMCAGRAPEPGSQALRRLSGKQLRTSVDDLFPTAIEFEGPFPEALVGIFDTSGGNNTVTSTVAFDLVNVAGDIATQATVDLDLLLGCSAADSDLCIASFIRDFGARAFRRPMSEGADGEYDGLVALYRTLEASEGVAPAVAGVIEAVLLSPQFLYIDNAIQTPQGDDQDAAPFDANALASRLSYFLWNSMPDARLLEMAEQGALSDGEGLASEARRMLADPRAHVVVRSFHRQWLNLREPNGLRRDGTAFPSFDALLVQDLYSEVDRFVDHVVWDSVGTFNMLMTDSTVFANDALEILYDLPTRATDRDDWAQTTVEARAGLLTRGAFLTNHAHSIASSPIQRGVFVIRRLLCREINVPENVDTSGFEPGPSQGDETVRDKLAQHRLDAGCAACHESIDPIGLAFEHFDAIGAFRTTYANGEPVDASGHLSHPEVEFANASELLEALASDPEVQTCYAQQWLSYAIGRNVGRQDACSVEGLRRALSDREASVQDVLVAVTQTDAFRFRNASELDAQEGVQP